ncbi:uncharacterized protein KQ657_001223 [Scheffersomyces spartinae]|uniref:Ketoreductase domain-containing protein n=1 Tax=Scheffersomyces spartinae TaxID=45513 RepID=A0A9P8AH98_9ASCO|nr:uncharacterized protein KQ657_001223 [Scheffersomyces spartinae]KAG7193106.1 hypothetical protein KQ657_001223 [Scheffersomyces spartinae]
MTNVILLTGASRGIGAAIARKVLADASVRLVAIARSSDGLQQLVDQYGTERVGVVVGDISEPMVYQKAVKTAIDQFGQLDVLVLNAGVLDPVAPIGEAVIGDWKRLFDINFFSIVGLVAEALPYLRNAANGKGKVIAVSSGASTKAYSSWGAYGASKAALNHYILSLSSEEQPLVEAISVAPGVVDTQMQSDIREVHGSKMSVEGLQRFIDLKKNNQLVHPDEPAAIYAGLALREWPPDINGKYLRYNDQVLSQFN